MPLLADYVITPDVFDVTSYSTDGECAARIETIRQTMLTEGLVRDLRGGAWSGLFVNAEHGRRTDPQAAPPDAKDAPGARAWHRRGVELVKKLRSQRRLVNWPPIRPEPPADDGDWCAEALATHARQPLSGGVIVTKSVKTRYAAEPVVTRIDRLRSAPWWTGGSRSIRLPRTAAEYERHLDLVLRHSKSLMFIDPHLDVEKPGYRYFPSLLQQAGGRTPAPLIEIHRCTTEDHDPAALEYRFRSALTEPLRGAGLEARVFLWTSPRAAPFHDRYLIGNFMGILLPYGFDEGGGDTTWAMLDRNVRDAVQREFDPATPRRTLARDFEIPGRGPGREPRRGRTHHAR